MNAEIKALITQQELVSDRLEAAIFEAVEQEARKAGLDNFVWTFFRNEYIRGEREVECLPLEELETIYYDHIHSGGIQLVWTREKGFV